MAIVVLILEMVMSGPPVVEDARAPDVAEAPPVPSSVEGLALAPVLVAEGLDSPTDVVGDPSSDRLFVVEKAGTVRIVDRGTILDTAFLDITRWVESKGNEQGMLSMRFHPQYEENGRVFFFFTDRTGTSQLVEGQVDFDMPDVVQPSSLRPVLTIPQYGQYHQSGSMFFGPDGYLWLSLGDGGGIGDPEGHGQDIENIDASIVRLDIDSARPYAIPDTNPFVGRVGLDEVWAYGLRNPWRISYDAETGYLYVPDVGQEGSEELNVVPLGEGGHNFGWSVSEGSVCYEAEDCDMSGHTMPAYQYLHDGNGCAIVGGGVYRGSLMPELGGHYFFADFCLGWIRSVLLDDDDVWMVVDWTHDRDDRLGNVTTFGTDRHGELYVANLEGQVWRLELSR